MWDSTPYTRPRMAGYQSRESRAGMWRGWRGLSVPLLDKVVGGGHWEVLASQAVRNSRGLMTWQGFGRGNVYVVDAHRVGARALNAGWIALSAWWIAAALVLSPILSFPVLLPATANVSRPFRAIRCIPLLRPLYCTIYNVITQCICHVSRAT